MVIYNGDLTYEVLSTGIDKALVRCNDNQLFIDQLELLSGEIYETDYWGYVCIPKQLFGEYIAFEIDNFPAV